ncbi:MAG: hypothetical protein RI988_734 [Pseudomonadota bacterium]|jgi:hypothetical protein
MRAQRVDLLINGNATGNAAIWPGGRGLFTVDGTFGGSTATLQFLGPTGNWIAAGPYTTLTAAGGGIFDLPQGQIRVSLSGGSPSGISAIACIVDL